MNLAINPTILNKIIDHFPKHVMRLAFAYGSGIFQQKHDKNMHNNMLDFIFVVDDAEKFHTENLLLNRNHYNSLRYLGTGNLTFVQNLGAGVYFNTLIKCENRIMKYGVIGTQELKNDLLDWESLYISGRLHKPVKFIHYNDDADLNAALTLNLKSAMHTSLLLLDDHFTEEDFFHTITGLSYSGDFRMQFGEDKNKINNIVKLNLDNFLKLYEPFLIDDPHVYWDRTQRIFEQSQCSSSRYHHLNLLPKMVLQGLVDMYNTSDGKSRDIEEVIYSLCHGNSCNDLVAQSVCKIVKKSSKNQSVKNIFTAGLLKSMRYSGKKIYKMINSAK